MDRAPAEKRTRFSENQLYEEDQDTNGDIIFVQQIFGPKKTNYNCAIFSAHQYQWSRPSV